MLTPSVRSTTEVDLNRPMQEGWLSRRSIMKTSNASSRLFITGRHVSRGRFISRAVVTMLLEPSLLPSLF
ncbi:unnamed protein product [Sphagnum balticum]